MSVIHGYVDLPIDTYSNFKNAVLGNSYDVDGYPAGQPCQCWDLTAEFWHNVGFPNNYPLTGGNDARGVWDMRAYNIINNDVVYFDLIEDINLVKRGDVVVLDGTIGNPYGHIFFADEDYTGDIQNAIKGLGQNQSGAYVDVQTLICTSFSSGAFRGAFRFKPWKKSTASSKKFPFVLYANKIRNNY